MKIVGLKKIYWLDFYQLESFLKVIFYKLDSYPTSEVPDKTLTSTSVPDEESLQLNPNLK